MYLSDEQSGAARWGSRRVSWEAVELPVGRQLVPAWAKDLYVDFADGLGNDPRYRIKADRDLRSWPDQRFTRIGDLFLSVSDDGRAEAYYQGGALTPVKVNRFRTEDGQLHAYRPRSGERVEERDAEGRLVASYVPDDPGEWVEVERLCTPQQGGFGGAHIDITMVDGTEVTLRGPWHGPCPAGFVECSYYDAVNTPSWYGRRLRRARGPEWLERVATSGLLVREAEFVAIFARFAPHLRLTRLVEGERSRIQALKPEWDAPKCVILDRERRARKQAEWDAMPPEDRPPHVMCSWPKVCGGKAHCAVAECNHCTPRKAAA